MNSEASTKPRGRIVKNRSKSKRTEDEAAILGPFLEFAEDGEQALAAYLDHCGITAADIEEAGHTQGAILSYYRKPGGGYDIEAAARDLASWPPIKDRIRELRREQRIQKFPT
jgi:hypothetical protein